MCNPAAFVAMQGIGLGLAAKGRWDAARLQQTLLSQNAQMADWAALDALTRGKTQQQNLQLQAGQLQGRQQAMLAASGVGLESGSAARVVVGDAWLAQRQTDQMAYQAARQAWGHRVQAGQFRRQAWGIHPGLAAVTTLLTGAKSVAPSWGR